MMEDDKGAISRRKLLGGAGKLVYMAPTVTLLSMVSSNAHAVSVLPPCPPNDPAPGCEPQTGAKRRKKTVESEKPKKPSGD
jgi:hypothetical protein